MSDKNDIKLLKGIVKGDNKSFKLLFDRFYDQLFLFGIKYVPNAGVVEDIIQNIFINLWENKNSFANIIALKSFLYRSVRNACLNHIQRSRLVFENDTKDVYSEEFFLNSIVEQEVFAELKDMVEELPESCKNIFKLSLEGLKNDEIAEDLNISINTVKTQKQRAKKYIKLKLAEATSIVLIIHQIVNDLV